MDWAALGDGPAGLIAERVLSFDVAVPCAARGDGALLTPAHTAAWTAGSIPVGGPCSFLNTSSGQCVQVDIPELRDHELLALTPEGLLVLVHKPPCTTVRLLNPLTRHLTELPPLTTLLPPDHHDKLSSQYFIHTYFRAWGSGIANDDSTVVLCFNRLCMLAKAKPGDDRWTLLDYKDYNGRQPTMAPLMFAGRFYCVYLSGSVMVLEMGADQPPQLKVAADLSMLVPSMGLTLHLVNNCGELNLVHRRDDLLTSGNKPGWWYDTYRVDLDTGTLVPVKSLGSSAGRAVFMGMFCSLSVSLESFPSGSICADTIYLSFDLLERRQHKIEAYHLIDGIIEPTSQNWGALAPRPHTLADSLSLSCAVEEW